MSFGFTWRICRNAGQVFHIRIWISSKNAASMTIETSIGQETCLILGQVSLNFFYLKRNVRTEKMWSGGTLTKLQVTSRPENLWPELWIKFGKKC